MGLDGKLCQRALMGEPAQAVWRSTAIAQDPASNLEHLQCNQSSVTQICARFLYKHIALLFVLGPTRACGLPRAASGRTHEAHEKWNALRRQNNNM